MPKMLNIFRISAVATIVFLGMLASIRATAQDSKQTREVYQAQAMGTLTQTGRTFNVTVNIEQYSPPEERQILVDAFGEKGSDGLYNALEKMPSKGRLAMTGTLGYDISFARKIPIEGGFKIRVLTNRPIEIGEAYVNGRTMDYNLSAVEMDINSDKSKNTGVLLPAVLFKIDKKTGEVAAENYQNPWKLVNIMNRSNE